MVAETAWITERDLGGVVTADPLGPFVVAPIVGPDPVPAAATPAAGDKSLLTVERDHIIQTLERTGGNKARAATLLRISRRTLYRLIQQGSLDDAADTEDGA